MTRQQADEAPRRTVDLSMDPDWLKYDRRGRSYVEEQLIFAELGRGTEEIERRQAQLELIDQIEGADLLIDYFKQKDEEEMPRLWRRLARLEQEMMALSDPDEICFFSLRAIPPEFAGGEER